jgi:hypothetical protein
MTRIPAESTISREDHQMNSVLYASIEDVKAVYVNSYEFADLTPVQINKLVCRHFVRQDLLLRKVHTLPCQIELVIRLAVHFDCEYHEVLKKMASEYLASTNQESVIYQPRQYRPRATKLNCTFETAVHPH